MTKRTFKNFLRSAILIILSVAMVAFPVGCDEADNNTNIYTYVDDAVPVGAIGDVENFETSDETPLKKRVAITFDDGPHNVFTQAIVDELDKYGFHATFFVVGNRVDGSEYGGGKTIPYI